MFRNLAAAKMKPISTFKKLVQFGRSNKWVIEYLISKSWLKHPREIKRDSEPEEWSKKIEAAAGRGCT